jgi:hypothetical protein
MYKIKPTGRRLFKSLTEMEKKEIARRQAAGQTQVSLALAFRCTDGIIRKVCKHAGVGRWATLTPELEKEAVRLLWDGMAFARVAKKTRLPDSIIKTLMAKHGIVHPVGGGPKLPREKLKKVVEAVCEGNKYCKQIGRELGVDRDSVRRYAHKVRGAERFLPGNRVPPMTQRNSESLVDSNFHKFLDSLVHKGAQAMKYETIWRQFLEGYLERNYNGVLPPDRSALVSEVMTALFPAELQHFPIKGEVRGYIVKAVDSIASTQSGLVH